MFRGILFLVGLTLSCVAAFYSVTGLAFVFAGAFWPVVIMGGALEAAKLTAASWVFRHWKTAPKTLVTYLSVGVLLLMLLTGVGIFGYLSRAYLVQQAPIVALAAENAAAERTATVARAEYDRAVAEVQSFDGVQSTTNQVIGKLAETQRLGGRNGAVSVLRSQQALQADARARLSTASDALKAAEQGVAEVEQRMRLQTVDVGPLMFAAKAYYGNSDVATMDKVVTAFIILILAVFDPMAIALLLAAQAVNDQITDAVTAPVNPQITDAVTQNKIDRAWEEMVEEVEQRIEREQDMHPEEHVPAQVANTLYEERVPGKATFEPATIVDATDDAPILPTNTETDDLAKPEIGHQIVERPLRQRRTRTAPKR
jgi:hypothetical protein